MYAAIAGLRTHMQNLNVIGNNVANVNTQSYKSARSVFKSSIYTTISGGSDGTAVVGGANPSQIGYGSNMASVDIDMSTGNFSVTGSPTDMMIDGDGFFLMGNKDIAATFDGDVGDVNKLTSLTLTRLGNFEFKADGYLTNNDLCVYGFMCTGIATAQDVADGRAKEVGKPMFSDQLVPIRYPRVKMVDRFYDTNGVELTGDDLATAEAAYAAGNLPGTVVHKSVPTIMYATDVVETTDAGGAGGAAGGTTSRAYTRLDDYYEMVTPVGDDGQPIADADPVRKDYPMAQFNGITVDKKTGMIYGTSNDTNEIVYIGCIAIGQVTNPNGVTQIGNSYYNAGPGSGDLTVSIIGGGAEEMGLSYINRSLTLMDAGIGPDGVVGGTGDAADANAEPEMLDGLRIRSGGKTGLQTNGLEMSKTDLAQEIANMILTQRGYQANTRIVTVTDSMLEELVNMKR